MLLAVSTPVPEDFYGMLVKNTSIQPSVWEPGCLRSLALVNLGPPTVTVSSDIQPWFLCFAYKNIFEFVDNFQRLECIASKAFPGSGLKYFFISQENPKLICRNRTKAEGLT